MESKYFVFAANKGVFLAEKQSQLDPNEFFVVTPNSKTTIITNTIVDDINGVRISLVSTRGVFVLETNLVDWFADLEANCEYSSSNPDDLRVYLATPDGV